MAYLRPVKIQPTPVEACFRTARERLEIPDGVRIQVEGLESLPPVLAGEEQLRLVFFNLMDNALDALATLPESYGRIPTIRVRGCTVSDPLGGPAKYVEITVSDNGPGVPPERRENIFDLAFSTKRSPRKLGFGLWWVRTLVTRVGGEIRLADFADPGCAFVIRLPSGDLHGGLPGVPPAAGNP
jgi:signal transduction histidine kinase